MRKLLKRFPFRKNEESFSGALNQQTRLHALYRLELALTSTLDLQSRLEILLEHTTTQMRADIGIVFLMEPTSNELAVIAQRGAKRPGSGYGFRLNAGEGAAGWIAQHGRPLAIPDVRRDARWKRVEQAGDENIVSYLGVPLVADGRTIGVLDAATRTRRVFSEEDVEFFEMLAGRAAVSIKNAQMVEELRLYKNALNSTADAIAITDLQGRILDVNPAFERLTGYARAESLGRNMSLVKSKRSTLEFYQKMWAEILSNGHWIGEIVNRRKNGEEWRSWNTISTVRDEGGRPIAYVGVNRDISGLRQTEAALSRRVKELEFLHRAALTVTATPDLDAALEQVLNLMSQEFGYPYLAVGLIDQDGERIRLRVQRGIHADQWGPDGRGLLPGQGLVGWTYQHGEPLLVNDVSLDPRYVLGIPATRSELVVPLRFGNRTIGVINVECPEKDAFGPEDLRLLSTLAHQLATAIENARLFDAERTRRDELAALYDLSRALADTAYNVGAILETVALYAVKTVHVAFASASLFKNGKFVVRRLYPARLLDGERDGIACDPLHSLPVCSRAAQQNAPVVLHVDDPELADAERERLFLGSTRTICLVPLRVADRFLGFLMLGEERRENREPFDSDKVRLARSIGDQAASALNRAELFAELEESYLQTVFALANAVDAKDTYTANHAQQLADLALAVGRKMGLSPREMEDLRYGAILHDIGKIGIPDAILQKPAGLTDEEWKWMRQHPEIGARILAPIPRLSGASRIVRHHHERMDGGGYPDGLSGNAIPLVARILTVVDAYTAILDARPYKPSLSRETAIAELKKHSGAQFDSCVVNAFLNVLERGGAQLLSARQNR